MRTLTKPRLSVALIAMSVLSTALLLPMPAAALTSQGDINVSGAVTGPPPSTAPTIEEPASNTTFNQKSITVKGSCIAGLVVKVYRNGFFAGSALCQPDGKYSLQIDLFLGKNDLVARQSDSMGQTSPDSNIVTVFYTTPSPQLPSDTSTPSGGAPSTAPTDTPAGLAQFQLVIEYDYTLQSIYVNQPFYLPIKFAGGTGPYAVSIDWGDGTSDIFSRDTTDQFTVDHTYTQAGYYTASLKVSDKNGDQASMTFVLLVNGEPDTSLIGQLFSDQVASPWQLILITGLIILIGIVAFAIGLRIGKNKKLKT
jgi:hypothetical protein